MKAVLGIDTGGTYTDAVLLEQNRTQIIAKAKSPTTRDDLSIGILNSIEKICQLSADQIEKVVLSTTLATNAIVEGEGRKTALILIGDPPKGDLPDGEVFQITGKVNIKGKEIIPVDPQQVQAVCQKIDPQTEAVAVSGMMSVRNASQELLVKSIVEEQCSLPVVCGHELSSKLGFHDRTVTAVLNASLIPIIRKFIDAVKCALAEKNIEAPIFMVKGDGNLASLDVILKKPIESILSGPAASVIGALRLAGVENGIVSDMGGTTTDSGIVLDNTLSLSPLGACVGEWQTQIDSAMIHTFGLGGDTQILTKDGRPVLEARRILPACRGGEQGITPTDCLHVTRAFTEWDCQKAEAALGKQAEAAGMEPSDYVRETEEQILQMIEQEMLAQYSDTLPIIAIGAPAMSWYTKLQERTGRQVIVPEHYEVANAVGAAMAAVEERVEALVRPDEAEEAFVAHIAGEWGHFKTKEEAVAFAQDQAQKLAEAKAKEQGASTVSTQIFTDEIIETRAWQPRYVETRIKAVAKATQLKLAENEEK